MAAMNPVIVNPKVPNKVAIPTILSSFITTYWVLQNIAIENKTTAIKVLTTHVIIFITFIVRFVSIMSLNFLFYGKFLF
ncbi:hypothetical protein LOCUS_45780 [Klebsiella pneumoniae]|nr:hypothetical protein LOCUS_45780 [Klebsiella pneumoniae]